MLNRRSIAIPALLLAVTAGLSSCGFDYATDRVNQLGSGANDRSATLDALGVRILSAAAGEGRLLGTLVNNDNEEPASLESVTGDGITADFEPVEVRPGKHVNLSRELDVPVTGDFAAGDVVTLELGLSTGDTLQMNVPVVKNCYQYTAIPEQSAGTSGGEVTPEEPGSPSSEAPSVAEEPEVVQSQSAEQSAGADEGDTGAGSHLYTCSSAIPTGGAAEEH